MTYCSVVTVLALVGLTKERFGHYAVLKILYLRSSSTVMVIHKVCSINFEPPAESSCMNAISVQLWLFLVKIRSSWHDLM